MVPQPGYTTILHRYSSSIYTRQVAPPSATLPPSTSTECGAARRRRRYHQRRCTGDPGALLSRVTSLRSSHVMVDANSRQTTHRSAGMSDHSCVLQPVMLFADVIMCTATLHTSPILLLLLLGHHHPRASSPTQRASSAPPPHTNLTRLPATLPPPLTGATPTSWAATATAPTLTTPSPT
jgi:hypothetical protein